MNNILSILRPALTCIVSFLGLFQVSAQDPISGSLISAPALRGALVSAVLIDLETGEELSSHRPTDRLCPASVWKLLTCTAALESLGPDFNFRTLLAYRGDIIQDTLHGDLIVLGGGDPSLASSYFQPDLDQLLSSWATAIRAKGIAVVRGDIRAYTGHFEGDGIPGTRVWEDMANYYGAAVYGLNVYDNSYSIHFDTGTEAGVLTRITAIRPEVPELSLSNEVLSARGGGDQAYIFGAPGTTRRSIRGTLPMGHKDFAIRGSLPDPPQFLLHHLHRHMAAQGIAIDGKPIIESNEIPEPATLRLILEHRSPPLKDLVRHTLVKSDNLFAETLLRQLGHLQGSSSLNGALEALRNHFAWMDAEGGRAFFAYDGSGLSRFTSISARSLAALMHRAYSDDVLRPYMLEALPKAGQEGTMKYFVRGTSLEGQAKIKSGSMDGVRAIAGHFESAGGRQLACVLMVNAYEGSSTEVRKAMEGYLLEAYRHY